MKKLEEMNEMELKALAFDCIKEIERLQMNLQAINRRLNEVKSDGIGRIDGRVKKDGSRAEKPN